MICSSLHRPLCTLLLGIGLLASSCQQGEQRSTRLQIATTIAPAAQVITEIADSLVTVTTLLPQGNNPENYEPTPQAIQALASSAAYFYMGDLGFERSWVERIRTMQPALQLVRLDQDLVGSAHLHNGNPTNLHDPHYWTSIRGLRSMGKSIYSSLCRIDTMHRAQYDAGYQRFTQRLEHVEQTIKELLSDIPSRAFVIYHPSLSEFAEEYGLKQLVIEQDGKEPTPQHIQALIEEAKKLGVRVVFIQQEFDSKLIESIAKELDTRMVVINPLGGGWEEQLLLITRALSDTTSSIPTR